MPSPPPLHLAFPSLLHSFLNVGWNLCVSKALSGLGWRIMASGLQKGEPLAYPPFFQVGRGLSAVTSRTVVGIPRELRVEAWGFRSCLWHGLDAWEFPAVFSHPLTIHTDTPFLPDCSCALFPSPSLSRSDPRAGASWGEGGQGGA